MYTNKKNLKDSDTEVSAFLHLDLDNLGATDVSVKMLRKNVSTMRLEYNIKSLEYSEILLLSLLKRDFI